MSDNFYLLPNDDEPERSRHSDSSFRHKLADIRTRVEDFLRGASLVSLTALTFIAGSMTGLIFVYQTTVSAYGDDVDSLADYRPAEITKVYADDGKTVIGELALERRIPLAYEEIPDRLKQAILAIEDTRFYDHFGIDPVRLGGAVVESVMRGRQARGTSTLTQQLARGLFLSREQSYVRKFREAIYALQIERVYTKEQILSLYCNQIFLGGGAYGFEAASHYYFSKPLKELDLHQYALLAALPKAPQQYSPIYRKKQARERRNLVLESMADAGFISAAEAEAAQTKDLDLKLDDQRGKSDRSLYAYFLEEVRQELQKLLVEKHERDAMEVYKAGLSVYTTINADAQRMAVAAVRKGARAHERRHGWRVKFDNITEGENATDVDSYSHPSWIAVPAVGDFLTGLIKEVNDKGTLVSFGNYSATITGEHTEALSKPPSKLFKRGDLAQFKIEAVDQTKKTLNVTLDPEPDVQAALVLLEAKTGEIKAMVGGYNFATSKFNHATQANRQTGSAFKPFIYATALEQGLKPDDVVNDSPFRRGSWAPHNYDNRFMGTMPIRKAIAQSRNIPAVRVLDEVGVQNAVEFVKRIGLPNKMAPFLPSALGATEEPLLDMVSAYSTFPNMGVRVEPVRIRKVVDRDGNTLDEAEPKSYKVLSEWVAAQMNELLRGVVQSGTAGAAASLGHPLAGKTGTVNDFTDAWFIGYTPSVVCGVWIGYSDSKKPLGKGESGSSAALPFWMDFMRDYLKARKAERRDGEGKIIAEEQKKVDEFKKEKFPPIPDVPDELRSIQAKRAREHAQELARIATRSSGILPGERGEPNLDPLGDSEPVIDTPPPANTRPNATPPMPVEERPANSRKSDNHPKLLKPPAEEKPAKQDESGRKGKKGKVSDEP
jgi:penicillin-binding protein 1A